MKIHFTRSEDKHILIDVSFYVNSAIPTNLTMVLDTGANRTVIGKEIAEMLGFVGTRKNRSTMQTANGEIMQSFTIIPTFIESVGLIKDNLILEACNLGDLTEFSGYLGLDFFEGQTFKIDLKNDTLEILP